MKQNLYINQITWYRKQARQKLENLSIDKEKGFVTESSYRNARSRLNGMLNALDMDHGKDIHEQIMYNLIVYQKAEKDLKVNVLDSNESASKM